MLASYFSWNAPLSVAFLPLLPRYSVLSLFFDSSQVTAECCVRCHLLCTSHVSHPTPSCAWTGSTAHNSCPSTTQVCRLSPLPNCTLMHTLHCLLLCACLSQLCSLLCKLCDVSHMFVYEQGIMPVDTAASCCTRRWSVCAGYTSCNAHMMHDC